MSGNPEYRMLLRPVLMTIGLLSSLLIEAQSHVITGRVTDGAGVPVEEAQVMLQPDLKGELTDAHGYFTFEDIDTGVHILQITYLGKSTIADTITVRTDLSLSYALEDASYLLDDIEVAAETEGQFGITHLKAVEGLAIYASKKSEVVMVDKLNANLAANLSRQVYAKVPGLNIWESDGAGVQLGIGGRGLSPNRNSNFNTRQNGYDISADALGYPESYYTPPVEAIERIEIVRGAASLQYGTQFGGMLNFKFKQGARDKKFALESRQTGGSFGFFSSFNRIGGTVGKVNYTGFYQYKRTDGWRPNSGLDQHTGYASVEYTVNSKLRLRPEITLMRYLAQQPGGLTDAQFEMDPGQSNRERNWFAVDWNMFALSADYTLNDRTAINTRFFGLIASRDALGNLGNINTADFGGNRDFITDDFRNWGNETRLMHKYTLKGHPSTVLVGLRYYNGFTHRRQGDGNDGSGPDFHFLNPEDLEGSDYDLPSENISFFAENVFVISDKLSITPGIRFEHIFTGAEGYYRNTVRDLADNVLIDEKIYESKTNTRSFLFAGIGVSFRPSENIEVYANLSQNYRAINFNDIRITVGNLIVDQNLKDERGFNADLGIRGNLTSILNFDLSIFHLNYNDRIGTILKKEPNPNFNNLVDRVIRFRTNVADAHLYGIEGYAEVSLFEMLGGSNGDVDVSMFANIAVIEAQYVNSEADAIEGNRVELVPRFNGKIGAGFRYRAFRASVQYAYLSEQFSDASNAVRTANAVEGIIPAYHVADISVGYRWRMFRLEGGVNNFTNNMYFTRRASGYPGPGIIPSAPISFYLTVGVRL